MKQQYPPGATLRLVDAHRNSLTVEADNSFQNRPLVESDRFGQILVNIIHRLPFGDADEVLVDVYYGTVTASRTASRHTFTAEASAQLVGFVRTVAIRTLWKEYRIRRRFASASDIESHADPNGEALFTNVEARHALEVAVANLEEIGVRRDWVSAVVLHLIGWKPSDIAEAFGAKVETIRKRIARSRPTVIIELRKQFALEVN